MNPKFSSMSRPAVLVMAGAVLATGGCKPKPGAPASGPTPVVTSELNSNNLAGIPGAVYRSQKDSPIHWQPWTPESLKLAASANRLVFGVIAMPQQAGYQQVLASLAGNPELVSQINSAYVPVLIDGDAARETSMLTADLCTEIKKGIQLPMLVWMTPEGSPIAWIPVPKSDPAVIFDLFQKSDEMVTRMWLEDPEYVLKNSALDNAGRRKRIALRKNTKVVSKNPSEDTVRGIRQLASFYDVDSRSFDEAGGLFPSGSLDLLATAAVQPGLSAEVRDRCLATTRYLLEDLLVSPMFDPLDGGIYSGRRGKTWKFPSFARDGVAQSRAAVALFDAYRATGNALALEKAVGLLEFSEKEYQTPGGLFAAGLAADSEPSAWLWKIDEIQKLLSPEEAALWIKASDMKDLGNLPFEVDPKREFFRGNSISLGQTVPEIATRLSLPLETLAPRLVEIRKKLLNVREARLGQPARDDCPHAAASFRMVSAYAAAFGATGDEQFRAKAVALLDQCRTAFADGPKLRMFATPTAPSIGAGRAFLYALALQAAVDVATITSDEKWLVWSEDMATTAAELFTDKEFLKECPDDARIIDLPITDLVMLFDDSTAGLIAFAECRLAIRGRPLVRSFSELAMPLPYYVVDRPILHTDLIQATLAREFTVTVVSGKDLAPDLKLAVERLPMRMIQRRAAKSTEEVPPGSALVLLASGESRIAKTPAELQEAVLPSVTKS